MNHGSTASQILSRYFAKAGGPGSRGGHVIGRTKSGKAIYSSSSSKYSQSEGSSHFDEGTRQEAAKKNFSHYSQADHSDALDAHRKEINKIADKHKDYTTKEGRSAYAQLVQHHHAANHHRDLMHYDAD